MADTTVEAALRQSIRELEVRMNTVEREMEAKVTVGSLNAHNAKLQIQITDLKTGLQRVESKVQNVLEPSETLAFIGVEDLRMIKTRLKQLIAIKDDIDTMKKQLVDMLTAYDLGQATTLKSAL